jgi:hypothetical protein
MSLERSDEVAGKLEVRTKMGGEKAVARAE